MRLPSLLLPVCVFAGQAFAQPDAVAIVKKSIANHQHALREGEQWRYRETDATGTGADKKVEISEVTPMLGTPYERLIKVNGRPLGGDEEKREEQKYQKALEHRQKESPEERAARIKKYAHQWDFLNEIPDAYTFTMVGEEAVDGRPAWIINLTPRQGFTPKSFRASMLKHIEGKLWIDKQEVQWVKAEAHVRDTIGIGWILARVGPGAKIELTMTRVAEKLWLPGSVKIDGSAKVMMVHRKNLDEFLTYSDYARVGKDQPQNVSGVIAGSARSN